MYALGARAYEAPELALNRSTLSLLQLLLLLHLYDFGPYVVA